MMIQQMLPPQKLLLLHIETTSEKFFTAVCRSFQDIPEAEFGAKKPEQRLRLFVDIYFQRPSGYLPSLVSACNAALTTGLSAA